MDGWKKSRMEINPTTRWRMIMRVTIGHNDGRDGVEENESVGGFGRSKKMPMGQTLGIKEKLIDD